MRIQWRRVQYGDSVEKGNSEGYSMGLHWRMVEYGDTVEKGTLWGYCGEGYGMGIQ